VAVLPDDARLVSINDHFVEPADLWVGRDQPRVETVDGEERWVFGRETLSVRSLSVLGRTSEGARARRFDEMHPAVSDPIARVQSMDADGVAVHTVLPHAIGFAGERLRFLSSPGARNQAVRRYNDFVTREFCASAPARLAAVTVVPVLDLAAAAREVERGAQLGARAISVPHDPEAVGAPAFGDVQWDRVFSVAEEARLPVLIHVGSSGAPASVLGIARAPGAALVRGGFDVAHALADLMYAYVFVRHPKLAVVLVEGGIGWLAHVIDRMRFFARQRPELWAPPSRSRMPDEIVREQVHVTFIDDGHGLATLEALPVDRLHWQCDFPHADSPWPHSRAALAAQLQAVDPNVARRIAGANTADLLRL
jgi:predicted TIM-barrel fold metal-dependent hydrolase